MKKVKKKKKKSDANEIIKIKWEYKSEEQESATKNIGTLYESWEKVIKLFNDYSKVLFMA